MSYLDKKLKEMTKSERKIVKQVGGKYLRPSIFNSIADFIPIFYDIFVIVTFILSIFGIVETSIEFDYIMWLIACGILIDIFISGLGSKPTDCKNYHYITEKQYGLMCDIDARIVDESVKESLMDACICTHAILIVTQIEFDLSKMDKVKDANIHALAYDKFYIVSKVMEDLMKEVINYSTTHDNFTDLLTPDSVSRYKKIVDDVVSNFERDWYSKAIISSSKKEFYVTYDYTIDHMRTVDICKHDIIEALECSIVHPSYKVPDSKLIKNLFYAVYSVLYVKTNKEE